MESPIIETKIDNAGIVYQAHFEAIKYNHHQQLKVNTWYFSSASVFCWVITEVVCFMFEFSSVKIAICSCKSYKKIYSRWFIWRDSQYFKANSSFKKFSKTHNSISLNVVSYLNLLRYCLVFRLLFFFLWFSFRFRFLQYKRCWQYNKVNKITFCLSEKM